MMLLEFLSQSVPVPMWLILLPVVVSLALWPFRVAKEVALLRRIGGLANRAPVDIFEFVFVVLPAVVIVELSDTKARD